MPPAFVRIRFSRFLCLAALLVLATMIGCSETQEIRVYKVAKKDSAPRTIAVASSPGQDQQMLAAIVPNGSSAWFFKLKGEPEKVGKNRDEFRQIVDSVTFSGQGGPTWKLSDGWTQQLLQGITYAKLVKEDDGLTATVTELPVPDLSDADLWQQYVVENVNRWREQLTLDLQSWESIEPGLEEVVELSQGPAKAYFVSLVGRDSGGSMGGPFSGGGPMMNAPATPVPATPVPATPVPATAMAPKTDTSTASRESPLTYEAPEGWAELDTSASQMRLAAFSVDSGDSKAELTVIAAGGDIFANVGIWFGQISLAQTEDAVKEVVEAATSVEVNGVEAKVFTLDGSGTDGKQSIIVADVPWVEGGSLFVKLKGDSALIESQRENFSKFLQSIKW